MEEFFASKLGEEEKKDRKKHVLPLSSHCAPGHIDITHEKAMEFVEMLKGEQEENFIFPPSTPKPDVTHECRRFSERKATKWKLFALSGASSVNCKHLLESNNKSRCPN
jgi:hypothetical protein